MKYAAAVLAASEAGRMSGGRLSAISRRLPRFGAAGFVLFLVKGLLWLAAPLLTVWWRGWFPV